jgi:hypothetical protein
MVSSSFVFEWNVAILNKSNPRTRTKKLSSLFKKTKRTKTTLEINKKTTCPIDQPCKKK